MSDFIYQVTDAHADDPEKRLRTIAQRRKSIDGLPVRAQTRLPWTEAQG